MYLRASKDLPKPTHVSSLIYAPAFLTVFALYVVLVCMGYVLLYLYMFFVVLNRTDTWEIKKINKSFY